MSLISSRFLAAVRLCAGPMTIKDRLTLAWLEHLDDIDPDELPPIIRQDFINLRKAMYSRQPLPTEQAPQASIRKMSEKDVVIYTNSIIAMYNELLQEQKHSAQKSEIKLDLPGRKENEMRNRKSPARQLN